MKSTASKLKDSSKKGLDVKGDGSGYQALQHWDVFVSPGKFTLLDWYWLLEDEEEDITGIQVSSELISILFRGCLLVNVKQNLIPYVTEATKDEILETFQFVDMQTDCREPSYEDRIKGVDSFGSFNVERTSQPEALQHLTIAIRRVEPVPLQPDNMGPGWQQELAPLEELTKRLSEVNGQSQSHLPTPVLQEVVVPGTPIKDEQSSRRSSTKSKKKMSLVAQLKQPKMYELPSLLKKTRPNVMFGVLPKKTKTNKQIIRKKTSEFLAKPESRKDSLVPEHIHARSLPSFRVSTPEIRLSISSNAPPTGTWAPQQARKISLMLDTIKAPPAFRVFDHLEPANFPVTRTKPTYIIKDLEVSKDVSKPQGLRSRGPVLARKETDAAASSEQPQVQAPPLPTTANVLVMPDLLGLINLSPGVTVQPDARQSRVGTLDKVASGGLERQFDESTLKVLKQEKAHPKIMVWQLLERPTSRSVLRPDFK